MSRENILNNKRGRRWLLREEGDYLVRTTSHTRSENGGANDKTEATLEKKGLNT